MSSMSDDDLDAVMKRYEEANPEVLCRNLKQNKVEAPKTIEQLHAEELQAMSDEYEASLCEPKGKEQPSALSSLNELSTTNRIDEMMKNLQNHNYVFDDLALSGQITLFYAKPNTGKTLLFMHFLVESINNGTIKPEEIFYINADDDYRGLITKTQLAVKHGFNMLSPAESTTKPKEIISLFARLAEEGDAGGKIIILDTVKKFVNLMSKAMQSEFYASLRVIVAKNATVIMAGHANKYPDDEGNLVYEGTSDVVNDIDCMYSINRLNNAEDDLMVVEFRNEKSRGDVIRKASYQYNNELGINWSQRLESVCLMDDDDVSKVKADRINQEKIDKHESAMLFICNILKDGAQNQSSIKLMHAEATKDKENTQHDLANEITGRRLTSALDELVNIKWRRVRGIKNASHYSLIATEESDYSAASRGG